MERNRVVHGHLDGEGTFTSLTTVPGASDDTSSSAAAFRPGLRPESCSGTARGTVGSGAGSVNGVVRALHAFDDGGGPALYVGGSFSVAGGITTGGIARWNGEWSPVASGLGLVYAFTTFDSGSGPELYAAGNLSAVSAAGAQLNGVARLTPAGWVPLDAAFPATSTRSPSTTTAQVPPSTRPAISTAPAELPRTTSRSGMERRGRPSARVTATGPSVRSSFTTTARALRCTPAARLASPAAS